MQTPTDPRDDRGTRRRSAQRRAGLLLLAGSLSPVVLPVLAAGPAAAHDRLESTNPGDGATLDTAPDAVVLTMSSPPLALGTQVQVTGPDGVVSSGAPSVVDDTVTQPVPGERPAGDYEVRWRVTSSDGHPVSGSFTFTTTSAAGTPTAAPTTPAHSGPAPTGPSPAPSAGASTPATLDPSDPVPGGSRGGLLGVAAVVVVVLGGVGGVIGYRRRQR